MESELRLIWGYMKVRADGRGTRKSSARGKSIVGRDEFVSWSLGDPEFRKLYYAWVDSGGNRRMKPTVDRINNDLGYEMGNMQWLTLEENMRKGGWEKPRGPRKCKYQGVKRDPRWGCIVATIGYKKKKIHLGSFKNEEDAARAYNRMARTLFGPKAFQNEIVDPEATC